MALLKRLKEALGFIEYKINDHYIPAIEFQKAYFLPVKILKGPYKNFTFSFECVKWNRVIDGGGERMVAVYDLVPIEPINFVTSKKFKWVADDIWADYAAFIADNHNKLKEQVLQDKTEEYPDEDYRTDDLEEFTSPRSIRPKGSTTPTTRVRSKQRRTTTSRGDQGLHSKVRPTSVKGSD